MKGKIANLRRSGLCLLLAVCLMMSMTSFAFAAPQNEIENGKHEAIDKAVAKLIDLVVEYNGDAYKFAYDQAAKAGYVDKALGYMDKVLNLLDDKGADMQAKLDDLQKELDGYKADVAEAEQKLADAEAELNGYKQDLADAKVDLADAKAELAGYEADLAKAQADLAQAYADLDEAIASGVVADVEKAQADLAKAQADLDEAAAEIADAYVKIADADEKIADADEKIADADVKLADAKVQLADAKVQLADAQAVLDDAKASLDGLVVELKESVEAAKALLVEADTMDQATLDALEVVLDEMEQDADKMGELMGVVEDVEDAGIEVEIAAFEKFGTVYAAYAVVVDELIPVVRNKVIPTMVEAYEYAQEFVGKVMNKYGITFENAEERIPELVYNATHAKYVMSKDSYYVALGGNTAAQQGYVNMFAKELGLEAAYKDLTVSDLIASDLVAHINANAAEIAKADIITYQMDPQMLIEAALNGTADWSVYVEDAEKLDEVLGDKVEWSKYLKDAELLAKAEEMKDALMAELAKKFDEDVLAEVAAQVENTAYAFVAFVAEDLKAIKAIKDINPDATIVMLGMYNPFQGLVVQVGDTEVNLGTLCDKVVVATDVAQLLFAVATGDVTYVEISMAETKGYDKVVLDPKDPTASMNRVMKVLYNQKAMTVTADGQEYIYEEVLEALEIVKLPADTGDNFNLFLWASMAMLCAAAFVGMVGTDKVKNCAK